MRKFLENDEAVSPVVAALLLIMVVAGSVAFLGVMTQDVGSQTGSVVGKSNSIEITSIKITILGSELVKPGVDALAKAYNDKQVGVIVQSQGSGSLGITSGSGISSSGAGLIDIGTSDRKPTPDELEKYPDLNLYKFGTSGIVVIVNNGTGGPFEGIFNTTWLKASYIDNGGATYNHNGTNYRRFQMTGATGTEKAFLQYINGGSFSKINSTIPEVTGNTGMLETVKNNALSVGFIEYGYVDTQDKLGQNVYISGILDESNGITYTNISISNFTLAAASSNVNNSYYPLELAHPLYFVTNGKPSNLADSFIKWARSVEGESIIEKAGYISYMRELEQ